MDQCKGEQEKMSIKTDKELLIDAKIKREVEELKIRLAQIESDFKIHKNDYYAHKI